MYSCTWTCHNYLEFNVLRFANAPSSRHVFFFFYYEAYDSTLPNYGIWTNLICSFLDLVKLVTVVFFKFFSIVVFFFKGSSWKQWSIWPTLGFIYTASRIHPEFCLPGGSQCHTLFHMVTFGHKCRLICVQYIDKNGQYNKCHKVSCFTQDKLTKCHLIHSKQEMS